MLELWYRHLRGPGNYKGDICLFTNVEELPFSDIITIPVDMSTLDMKKFWCERVVKYENVPSYNYDVVFHYDMDILAVGDINPLFPEDDDENLWTASSLFPVHHWWNAGDFLNRCQYWYYNKVSHWKKVTGYSAAVFGCRSEWWRVYMSKWAALIESHTGAMPRLGDQSFLNLAAAKRLFPIKSFPLDVLMQTEWKVTDRSRLLHFAGVKDRLKAMEEHSIL